jgi:hypothetical protein
VVAWADDYTDDTATPNAFCSLDGKSWNACAGITEAVSVIYADAADAQGRIWVNLGNAGRRVTACGVGACRTDGAGDALQRGHGGCAASLLQVYALPKDSESRKIFVSFDDSSLQFGSIELDYHYDRFLQHPSNVGHALAFISHTDVSLFGGPQAARSLPQTNDVGRAQDGVESDAMYQLQFEYDAGQAKVVKRRETLLDTQVYFAEWLLPSQQTAHSAQPVRGLASLAPRPLPPQYAIVGFSELGVSSLSPFLSGLLSCLSPALLRRQCVPLASAFQTETIIMTKYQGGKASDSLEVPIHFVRWDSPFAPRDQVILKENCYDFQQVRRVGEGRRGGAHGPSGCSRCAFVTGLRGIGRRSSSSS